MLLLLLLMMLLLLLLPPLLLLLQLLLLLLLLLLPLLMPDCVYSCAAISVLCRLRVYHDASLVIEFASLLIDRCF